MISGNLAFRMGRGSVSQSDSSMEICIGLGNCLGTRSGNSLGNGLVNSSGNGSGMDFHELNYCWFAQSQLIH